VRVDPHANLTITLIRRNNFGVIRLGGAPRRPHPSSLMVESLRAQRTPACVAARTCGQLRMSECWEPLPFPYDAPVPGIAPRVDLAAAYEKTRDKHRVQPNSWPEIAEGKGQLLDVFA
jgi:hypothetical protein